MKHNGFIKVVLMNQVQVSKSITNTSDGTNEVGYMTIIEGLLEILNEVIGVEATEDIVYTYFQRRGENFGRKLGSNKKPQTAVKEFLKCFPISSEIISKKENFSENAYESNIQIKNDLITNLCNSVEPSMRKPLIRCTKGFIEGALSFMTCRKVNFDITSTNLDMCQGKVEFHEYSGPLCCVKKYFHGWDKMLEYFEK